MKNKIKKILHKLFEWLWKITEATKTEILEEATRQQLSDEKKSKQFDWKFEFEGKKQLDKIANKILSKEMVINITEKDKFGTQWGRLADITIRTILCDWNELHKFYEKEVRNAYKKGVENTVRLFK